MIYIDYGYNNDFNSDFNDDFGGDEVFIDFPRTYEI